MTSAPSPGAADPAHRRTTLRVAGLLLTLAGLALIGVAVADLLGAFDDSVTTYELDGLTSAEAQDDSGPGLVWLLVLGLPALVGGVVCLRLAAAARGHGAEAGSSCPGCGAPRSTTDRFCGACGATLV